MKATFYCEKCKKEIEVTGDYPRYKKGRELCRKCFTEA